MAEEWSSLESGEELPVRLENHCGKSHVSHSTPEQSPTIFADLCVIRLQNVSTNEVQGEPLPHLLESPTINQAFTEFAPEKRAGPLGH